MISVFKIKKDKQEKLNMERYGGVCIFEDINNYGGVSYHEFNKFNSKRLASAVATK